MPCWLAPKSKLSVVLVVAVLALLAVGGLLVCVKLALFAVLFAALLAVAVAAAVNRSSAVACCHGNAGRWPASPTLGVGHLFF